MSVDLTDPCIDHWAEKNQKMLQHPQGNIPGTFAHLQGILHALPEPAISLLIEKPIFDVPSRNSWAIKMLDQGRVLSHDA
jgi:hypothetical protein